MKKKQNLNPAYPCHINFFLYFPVYIRPPIRSPWGRVNVSILSYVTDRTILGHV